MGRRISGGTEKGENIVMSSHDKEQSHCDAYEKILDLDLFNALLALVVKMSDNKDAMLEYSRFISQKVPMGFQVQRPGGLFCPA